MCTYMRFVFIFYFCFDMFVVLLDKNMKNHNSLAEQQVATIEICCNIF